MRNPLYFFLIVKREEAAMLFFSKLKKRFTRQRRPSSKAIRRRKIEKYLPYVLLLTALAVVICLLAALIILKLGVPFYQTIKEPNAARDWILSFGSWSYLFFVAIIFLQIVVAILPGEPFQIAAGMAFGPVVGSLLSIFGTMMGSITTFMLTRIFGYKIIELMFSERTRSKMDLTSYNQESLERIVFISFLIPGTPKDFMSYAVGLTPLSLKSWIRIFSISRFPTIIMSVLGGSAMNNGNLGVAATYILVGHGISLVIYVFYEIYHRIKKHCAA